VKVVGYGKLRTRKSTQFNTKHVSPKPALNISTKQRSRVPKIPTAIPTATPSPSKKQLFIVGGGSSLANFEFSRLMGRDVMCVNTAIFSVPFAKYFVTKDYTWLVKKGVVKSNTQYGNRERFLNHKAIKVFMACLGETLVCTPEGYIDTKFSLRYDLTMFHTILDCMKKGGIGLTKKDARYAGDSGYSALQLAVILKYDQIFLLGYDMTTTNKTHYHRGYGDGVKEFQTRLDRYLVHYSRAMDDIKEKTEIEVFSCSPISRLNEFVPFRDIQEVLCAR